MNRENVMAEILKEVGAEKIGKEVYAKLGEIFPEEKPYCDEVVRALEAGNDKEE